MLLEGGTSAKRIPDTLQAMIAARIDRLPTNEKRLLQRASVIGRIFWEGAVARLAPELENIEPVLDDLLARDFLTRESRSTISGEPSYRFKHVLIRDVAYSGLAKAARAELHQEVASGSTSGPPRRSSRSARTTSTTRRRCSRSSTASCPEELAQRAAAALDEGRSARAGARGEPAGAAAPAARDRARPDARAPLPGRPRRGAARRPARARTGDGAGLQRGDRGRRHASAGAVARRPLRGRAAPRRRPPARPRADRAGTRAARGRRPGGPLRGAAGPRPHRLVARRPRGRRAVDPQGAGRRARDRPQGPRGERRGRARELGDRAARHRAGEPARCGGSRARRGERQHHDARLDARLAGADRLAARALRRGRVPRSSAPRSSSRSPAARGRSRASTTTAAGSSGAAATSRPPNGDSATRSGS